LNPAFSRIRQLFVSMVPHFRPGQCIILRSTVFPGTTDRVRDLLATAGCDVHVAFCPERIAEGHAMTELRSLPQIVAGCDDAAAEMAGALFARIARSLIRMAPLEAELTKIFANVWRYIQFATANQFFMIATDYGLDFYRIHDALTRDYPRMAGLPTSGFAAGPCLFKDTMQLAAAYDNNFWLGHVAMLVNEGMPAFVVRHLKRRRELRGLRVGILGMAYKAGSDDRREALSYKLRKLLEFEAADVRCTDPHVRDADLRPVDEVVAWSDVLVLGVPHGEYASIVIPERTLVVDIWNFYGKGARFE
jgi:UDP-N-acetyl-D-mannosaminuronic acid dehydrogenase